MVTNIVPEFPSTFQQCTSLLLFQRRAKEIREEKKVLKLCKPLVDGHGWDSINLEHPMTFETLVMKPKPKKAIVDDLHRFDKSIVNRSILVVEDIDCSFGLLGHGDFLEVDARMSSMLGTN
ncbi:hypothetical protein Ancab_027969 [Ancistrocladus abbreviatus]